MNDRIIDRYAARIGYSEAERQAFLEEGHRIRHVERLAKAAPLYSIVAEVVEAKHCNSGHAKGDRIVLDIDGNLVTKLCPKRLCVYLVSQLSIPVALINERLSEGHDPNQFHFMRYIRCPDTGVNCLGYGEVLVRVGVLPRIK